MAWVGKDPKDHLTPTPCCGQGCLYEIRLPGFTANLALNISRDGTLTASLSNLFRCLTTLSTEFPPNISPKFSPLRLKPSLLILLLSDRVSRIIQSQVAVFPPLYVMLSFKAKIIIFTCTHFTVGDIIVTYIPRRDRPNSFAERCREGKRLLSVFTLSLCLLPMWKMPTCFTSLGAVPNRGP